MSGINPSTSHYEDPTFRADDAVEVAIKKFIQSLSEGDVSLPQSGGFNVPPYDTQEFAYFGSTNNIQTITYKRLGAVVGTLTFTYVSGGASDDDNVQTIVFT